MYITNYNTAIHYCGNHYILCNNIVDIDSNLYENILLDNPEDEFPEIYQWYISDCSEYDVEYLREHFPGIIFAYSELLDLYILCVTHYGTSWDSVPWETDLKIKN